MLYTLAVIAASVGLALLIGFIVIWGAMLKS
jgi:hypothetical protein